MSENITHTAVVNDCLRLVLASSSISGHSSWQHKNIFRRFHPAGTPKETPTGCSVYHDAFIFNTVYAGGAHPPYHPAMFSDRLAELENIVNVGRLQSLCPGISHRLPLCASRQ
ncbi:MAG: hypothetical protein P1S60_12155 [Anaerolineae bacterium]|nr:hypothetical protein [Anaerolineae bacterium]